MSTRKRIIYSWSGGGAIGLCKHLGAMTAMVAAGLPMVSDADHDVTHVGTSAGAAIAMAAALGWTPGQLKGLLSQYETKDVIRRRRLSYLRAFSVSTFFDSRPIQRLLDRVVPKHANMLLANLEVTATDAGTGEHFRFGFKTGDKVDDTSMRWRGLSKLSTYVMASMSISGIWPYVAIGDRWFSDGGSSSNLPLPEVEFDELYLICADAPTKPRKLKHMPAIHRLIYNVTLLMRDQFYDSLEKVAPFLQCSIRFGSRVYEAGSMWRPYEAGSMWRPNQTHARPFAVVLHPSIDGIGRTLCLDHSTIDSNAQLCAKQLQMQIEGKESDEIISL